MVVGGARVVSGAEKKAFDRGGPVWPPRSNAADDRFGGGGLEGLCPPSQKTGGSAPQPNKKNLNYQETVFLKKLYQEKQFNNRMQLLVLKLLFWIKKNCSRS